MTITKIMHDSQPSAYELPASLLGLCQALDALRDELDRMGLGLTVSVELAATADELRATATTPLLGGIFDTGRDVYGNAYSLTIGRHTQMVDTADEASIARAMSVTEHVAAFVGCDLTPKVEFDW